MLARCLAALVLAGAALFPQSPPEDPAEAFDPGLVITTESTLVVVPLHVYKKKKSIDGLGKDAFVLLEDGAEQEIAFVEGPGSGPEEGRTVPIEIVILMDISHSVLRQDLLDIDTIRGSLLEGIGKNVLISVYGFAAKLTRFTGPTSNPARVQHALELAYAAESGQTKVYESVLQTARDAAHRGGNASRMLVVFSDGFSTSDFQSEWAVTAANAYGIPIYPVVLGHQRIIDRARRTGGGQARGPGANGNIGRQRGRQAPIHRPSRRPGTSSTRISQRELRQQEFADLGAKTGGRSFDLRHPTSEAIRSIFDSLATLAHAEYVVGYYPTSLGGEPTRRQVQVRLKNGKIGKLYGGRRVFMH